MAKSFVLFVSLLVVTLLAAEVMSTRHGLKKPSKLNYNDARSKLPLIEMTEEQAARYQQIRYEGESFASVPEGSMEERDVEAWSNAPTPTKPFTSSQVVKGTETGVPFRPIVKIFFKDAGTTYVCSGVVVNTNLVLTAGHCAYDAESGYFDSWEVIPAYNNGSKPYGSWYATRVWAHPGWVSSPNVPSPSDFALLQVQNYQTGGASIGSKVGKRVVRSNSIYRQQVTVLGYPQNLDSGVIMHRCDAFTVNTARTYNKEIGSDMQGGASGGPWFRDFGTVSAGQTNDFNYRWNNVVGITSYGSSTPNTLAFLGTSQIDATLTNKITAGSL